MRVPGAWRFSLLLGMVSASVSFLVPSAAGRNLVYDAAGIVATLSVVGAVLVGVRMHRPARSLPWYLFCAGLLLLVAGEVASCLFEVAFGGQIRFPSPIDALCLAFYPFVAAGLALTGERPSNRRGIDDLIDPLVIAVGFGLLFWVYFMEPYVIEAYAGNPSITPLSILTAVAYPSMDLLLLAALVRTLVVVKRRPPAYWLLGIALGLLLASDIIWAVAQAIGSVALIGLVDVGFMLFLALFGAAALHPSMAGLFEPVARVESRLTRPRLVLLAGASLMAPFVVALQAARGEPLNAPLFVTGSAALFLLVVARMAGMMRTQERAADRERILRQAGATLASSQNKEELHRAALEAILKLLAPGSVAGASVWEGPAEEMEEAASTGEAIGAGFGVRDLPEGTSRRSPEERSVRVSPDGLALTKSPKARELFVVPLRTRGENMGALVVSSHVPLPQESRNALEALGDEVALALENLQLLEEVRRTSILRERQRLSHEIHDTLAQGFASIAMNLAAVQLTHPEMFSDSTPAIQNLESARRTAKESLAETRRLVWALRPEALDLLHLPQALDGLAKQWSTRTGIEARFSVAGITRQLSPESELALLRAAQEALANVHKHADADRVVLTLSFLDDAVALDVSDDGVGFDPDCRRGEATPQGAGGFGLLGMRERVEHLGGRLCVESTVGEGTTLAVELPASPRDASRVRKGREREEVEKPR